MVLDKLENVKSFEKEVSKHIGIENEIGTEKQGIFPRPHLMFAVSHSRGVIDKFTQSSWIAMKKF